MESSVPELPFASLEGCLSDQDAGWVLLARVVRPQGRRGEVLADIFTEFPDAFTGRKQLFLRAPRSAALTETAIEAHWLHKGRVVLKFAQCDSINDAEKLRDFEVLVPREARMPLEGDAMYVSDLIGLTVMDVTPGSAGEAGEIVDVEPEGAGPAMLVIRTAAGEEGLIPFVRAYLRRVDLTGGRLEMELPEGLLATQAPVSEQEAQAARAQADESEKGEG